jgi:hypothetical protein
MSQSDSDVSSNYSSQRSEISWDSDTGEVHDYFVTGGSYVPYQAEPLARSRMESRDDSEDEVVDEDGILPSVLERRFKRESTTHIGN